MEQWKTIIGYENYEVSNFGSVRNIKTGRILKPDLDIRKNKGYYRITLSCYGKTKRISVHRLVAYVFIPNLENKPHINHKNGVKTNNNINNLEWCTPSENENHSYQVLGKESHNKKQITNGYKIFDSVISACQWVLDNNLCETSNINQIRKHIKKVCNSLDNRKFAYGYAWRWFNE